MFVFDFRVESQWFFVLTANGRC